MNIEIKKATLKEKELLWKLLQFALYDGSFFIDNKMNNDGNFEYNWFENYFTDEDRSAYFIKYNNNIAGFAMVNENLKLEHSCKAQTIAEFLVLPQYRKNHIGKEAAYMIFDKFSGEWEVQPMDNNNGAYTFWEKTIKEYSNGNYDTYAIDSQENIFVFKSKKNH